ncbi:MAG TPA: hypothetical protein VEB23_04975 [Ramlibacter sp.]|uniref:hypothetical protein n=1 Tax=Ramlibacter sp. TaxID=1917967 RepID=UPI002D30A502|nr:hypothetical protein [Ramlibacter sp.]HYD75753.1 hypothetical protein [Ramlibacter sp.]HYE39261.1 hypothetical protein [Ramlibacter sp.]
MLADTNERPGIEEQYQTAGNTSDLTVDAERRGAGDVLIAAGWSDSRMGMALLRLHSEWDAAAKPRRMTDAQVRQLAATIPDARGKPNMSRARSEAIVWYARELRLLATSLKSRSGVLQQIHAWALLKGISADYVGPALFHWLSPVCPVCDGHGLRKVPDQPALSGKRCHACGGSGKSARPEGSTRIQNHLDYCVTVARHSLKARLRREG